MYLFCRFRNQITRYSYVTSMTVILDKTRWEIFKEKEQITTKLKNVYEFILWPMIICKYKTMMKIRRNGFYIIIIILFAFPILQYLVIIKKWNIPFPMYILKRNSSFVFWLSFSFSHGQENSCRFYIFPRYDLTTIQFYS